MAGRVGDEPRSGVVDFRHLKAFLHVYQERNYAHAGYGIFATRKSIVRMMQNLERVFECVLFTEGSQGELVPGPFAERLYNDLRFLTAARHRMRDHVATVHENGRVVHVGSSSAVFRTVEFRSLFRGLQSLEGVRTCYSPVETDEAGKALLSGHCDLYIGCWSGAGSRFAVQDAGEVSFKRYRRDGGPVASEGVAGFFVVELDGRLPVAPAPGAGGLPWQVLDEGRWLYWLDHPEDCPPGTVILGPDAQMDSDFWQVDGDQDLVTGQPLHATFLKQHPYEFLPSLMTRILNRTHTV